MENEIKIIADVLANSDLESIQDNKDYKFLATQIYKELKFNQILLK